MRRVLAAALLLFVAREAQAGQPFNFTGTDLYAKCIAGDVGCSDYFAAADNLLVALISLGIVPAQTLYCLPTGVNFLQIEMVFEEFARRNPQYLNRNAGEVYFAALRSAWPCKG